MIMNKIKINKSNLDKWLEKDNRTKPTNPDQEQTPEETASPRPQHSVGQYKAGSESVYHMSYRPG